MTIKLHRDQFRWTNGRGHDQKPVLYSQKSNTYGLGKKEHNADQWWATAFDNQLKSLDVSRSSSGEVTVKQTKTNAMPFEMAITSRYYIKFVRGGILTGDVEAGKYKEAKAEVKEKGQEKKARKEKKENKDKSSRSSRESSTARAAGKQKEKKRRKADDPKRERKEKKRLRRLLEKEIALLQTVPAEA